MNDLSPYGDNPFINALGPIRDRREMSRALLQTPARPPDIANLPYAVRLHWLMQLREMHLPRIEELRLAESLDLATRHSYAQRSPHSPEVWSALMKEPVIQPALNMPAGVVSLVGHSGTGKTEAVTRLLKRYPQIIAHDRLPNFAGKHLQVAWVSVCVPPSGRTVDLAEVLMKAWDRAMLPFHKGEPRFAHTLAQQRRYGPRMLEEWRQIASSHFLGLLHLDEIQNLFKLATLSQRKSRTNGKKGAGHHIDDYWAGLPIVEDQMLKWILSIANEWGMALCISGTPDGLNALRSRFSVSQRISSLGHHRFQPFQVDDAEFVGVFLPALLRHQYVSTPLQMSDELAHLLIELTAGIPRLLVGLWIAAHRIAFERNEDRLRLEDLMAGAKTTLAPVMPAVQALNSGNPQLMERFEDLMPDDFDLWEALGHPL
ncbi:AAA family ATPase [Uliginosibacterium paludis]|uniref:AAA family ATPase n=1 Tax=Uliginosibacterium paludis TaxID=1615952 RepID=A0ABV2CUU2_9RHOO